MANGIIIFDIDGVIRDVSHSYRRAIADTVEHYSNGAFRPDNSDIDRLKAEGIWNNDWRVSQELIRRWDETIGVDYDELVAFFQKKYRGSHFDGYIQNEPLLVDSQYFEQLSHAGFAWGFFSGAMRGSAGHVLTNRLGLQDPVLCAMEDAPDKPDPTGLFQAIAQLKNAGDGQGALPVVYVGDTAADMQTLQNAKQAQPERPWHAVGVLPPHVRSRTTEDCGAYKETLIKSGADLVLAGAVALSPEVLSTLL